MRYLYASALVILIILGIIYFVKKDSVSDTPREESVTTGMPVPDTTGTQEMIVEEE